jgi:hemolysin activation/secretion protein
MAFRGLVTDQREFEIKRFQAKGNYLFATLGIERTQTLPGGFGLFLKIDGQLSNQPLISNEQYVAGGMKSVRGYKENEEVGDDALHGTVEFSTPDLVQLLGREGYPSCGAYAFYDVAGLRIQDPLPGQDEHATLQGAGAGVRGLLFKGFEYELAWAIVLESTDRTDSEDMTFHYIVRYKF